jgi:hypothetical protein
MRCMGVSRVSKDWGVLLIKDKPDEEKLTIQGLRRKGGAGPL